MVLGKLLRFAVAVAALAVVFGLYLEWRDARQESRELALQLATAEKILADAQERQKTRDAELHDTLAELAELKRRTKTPEDIARAITRELALPRPVTLASAKSGESAKSPGQGIEKGRSAPAPQEVSHPPVPSLESTPAQVPTEDLQPLFDFVIDCKACQARLSAAQGDLADERAKNAALAAERDAALTSAKGGGFWRRTRRAAKWFAIGAIAGAAATAAAAH
jgi:hypothetical protein